MMKTALSLAVLAVAVTSASVASADEPVSKSINALMVDFARGDVIPMENTLATFPVSTTTVRQYATNVLSTP